MIALPSLGTLEEAASVVYQHILPTPQIRWPLLCERAGAEVWVKHENHTPIGAFKVRGGLLYLTALRKSRPDLKHVIAATRGNHGQSIAFAATRTNFECTIVVPRGNAREKNAVMRALGAELVEWGNDFQDAYEHALELAARDQMHMVPSFDSTLLAGVATYSLELLRARPDLQTLYVPIGLGSGICGAIAAREALGLKTEIVGVVSSAAPAYAVSYAANQPISAAVSATLADGIACRVPDCEALEIIRRGAARVIVVSEDEIKAAIRYLLSDTHNLAEGAGAAAVAGLMQERKQIHGRRVGAVLSGGNIDMDVLASVLSAHA